MLAEVGTEAQGERSRKLLAELAEMTYAIKRREITYPASRRRLFRHHFKLNSFQIAAPAFRPLVERQWFKGDPIGDRIFRDQMIIDMHWCYCTGRSAKSAEAKAICADQFDIKRAEAFAYKLHRMKAKAAAFGLEPEDQLQCIWLCGNELRTLRDELMRTAQRHRRSLEKHRDSPLTPKNERASLKRIDIDKVTACWLARELSEPIYGTPDTSSEQRACVYRMITGQMITRNVMRHQLRQVEKHIGGR
jgi:hypothetical protein